MFGSSRFKFGISGVSSKKAVRHEPSATVRAVFSSLAWGLLWAKNAVV